MLINKAHWVTDGDNVRLSMPIGKVDVERRMVSGFATLDNIDKQGDIVTTESSINAFKNFRGNLREMHQPSAVGKIVSFKEDDTIILPTMGFSKLEHEGEEYWIGPENQVLGRLVEDLSDVPF